MISWIDSIVGRTLYPIIVKLCHWFDWNQYQVYRYCYVLSAMMVFTYAWKTTSWIFIAFTGFSIFFFTSSAVLLDGMKPSSSSSPQHRVTYVLLSILATILSIYRSQIDIVNVAIFVLLLAEYARAIDDIPPPPIKRRSVSYA